MDNIQIRNIHGQYPGKEYTRTIFRQGIFMDSIQIRDIRGYLDEEYSWTVSR